MTSILNFPESWKIILKTLKEKPSTFQELLKLGISEQKLNEILQSMEQLKIIREGRGFCYFLKNKEVK